MLHDDVDLSLWFNIVEQCKLRTIPASNESKFDKQAKFGANEKDCLFRLCKIKWKMYANKPKKKICYKMV